MKCPACDSPNITAHLTGPPFYLCYDCAQSWDAGDEIDNATDHYREYLEEHHELKSA